LGHRHAAHRRQPLPCLDAGRRRRAAVAHRVDPEPVSVHDNPQVGIARHYRPAAVERRASDRMMVGERRQLALGVAEQRAAVANRLALGIKLRRGGHLPAREPVR